MEFLSQVTEVSGMVQLYNSSIDSIILPNLRIIRGQNSVLRSFTGGKKYNVSLVITVRDISAKLTYLRMPSLRAIENNSVLFLADITSLPFIISWPELFSDPSTQYFLSEVQRSDLECHDSCSSWNSSEPSVKLCWSPSKKHCQRKTKCRGQLAKSDSTWCLDTPSASPGGSAIERGCSQSCVGGCYGQGSTKCYSCQDYLSGDRCVSRCPPKLRQDGKNNPDYRVRVGQICARKCPEKLLLHDDDCIAHCPTSKYRQQGRKCVRIDKEPDRNTYCNTNDLHPENSTLSFFITKQMLQMNLSKCRQLKGELHFTTSSFNPDNGGVTVTDLFQHLAALEVVIGDILVDGSGPELRNLSFLRNLREIRHYGNKISSTSALKVFYSNIEFLGLQKLRHVFGDIYETENPHLCYVDTVPWDRLVLKNKKFDHEIKNRPSCANKTCDPQCGSDGCWGPSSNMCYNCREVRAGTNCVNRCEDEPGHFSTASVTPSPPPAPLATAPIDRPYDDGSCGRCHPLCGPLCSGPSLNQCLGRCRIAKESGVCVGSCSHGRYPSSADGECRLCAGGCLNIPDAPVCSGPGLEGSCSFCKMFLQTDSSTYRCQDPSQPPHGHFLTDVASAIVSASYPRSLVRVYKPCSPPCSNCSGPGVSRPSVCAHCAGKWTRDLCVLDCPPGARGHEVSPGEDVDCPDCHNQCRGGCYRPRDPSACDSCLFFRVIVNSSTFLCLASCPPDRNRSYIEPHTSYRLCLTPTELATRIADNRSKQIRDIVVWIFIPILSAFAVFVFIVSRRLQVKHRRKSNQYLQALYSNIQEPDSKVLLRNRKESYLQPNMDRLLLIRKSDLDFSLHRPLGQGAFGAVYRGLWRNEKSRSARGLDVAVKVLTTTAAGCGETAAVCAGDVAEIMREARVMASVSHRHCLRLIGLCLLREQPLLVTAFMRLGSLDKYIQARAPSPSSSSSSELLSSYTLLSWAEQIANGMAYLEMRGIIHRDLATRNVLLQSPRLVQITDFGLSRVLQGTEDNHEMVITAGPVPVRWLALETLVRGIYSHKTDVWAYGVTLWEIFSYGQCPYSEMSPCDISPFVVEGGRLAQPEIAALDTYVILNRCWSVEPMLRPSFEELMTIFSNFSRNSTYYLNIPNDPSLQYSVYKAEQLEMMVELRRVPHGYQRSGNSPSRTISRSSSSRSSPLHSKRVVGTGHGSWLRYLYGPTQLSTDGTVTTELGDYRDSDLDDYDNDLGDVDDLKESQDPRIMSGGAVTRQFSNASWLSRKISVGEEKERKFPLLQSSLTVKEENEGYLVPLKLEKLDSNENNNNDGDDGYLNPISEYSTSINS